ncbi:hypothetical protein H0H81_006982 [Sphagnurus paluster]|uniref:Uncharacterized protein n=1 Tax=Sphagnurus paluster TaxID=117069 RepID=A0A9P7KLT5_9AGAR|nr:hypothetical protein H0H81_006982 [Sphagnurus paluster]
MYPQVASINAFLFACSIAGFSWVLAYNTRRHKATIASAIHLPLPGCPAVHSGLEWVQWVPATAFEGLLFGFALFKTLNTPRVINGQKIRFKLLDLILRDNLLVGVLLICNNLMVVVSDESVYIV